MQDATYINNKMKYNTVADLGGGCGGCAPPLPEMTCG